MIDKYFTVHTLHYVMDFAGEEADAAYNQYLAKRTICASGKAGTPSQAGTDHAMVYIPYNAITNTIWRVEGEADAIVDANCPD